MGTKNRVVSASSIPSEWGFRGKLILLLEHACEEEFSRRIAPIPLERSRTPDYGDYYSTIAIENAQSLGMSAREAAKVLAEALPKDELVVRADAHGDGFVNIFVRYRSAAQALAQLRHELRERLLLIDAEHPFSVRGESAIDPRWQTVREIRELIVSSNVRPYDLNTTTVLHTLTDPEEMDLILQLHEISRIATQPKLSTDAVLGYLYVTAVKFRNAFVHFGRIAPFWIDPTGDRNLSFARRFLVGATLDVLNAGLRIANAIP